jgi:hypothetical protein
MEAFPDLASISDDDIYRQLRALEDEEEVVSRRRRLLHVQIDALRLERIGRLREEVAAGGEQIPADKVAQAFRDRDEPVEDVAPAADEIEPIPDPASLDDEELRTLLRSLEHDEGEISLHRRILHGRIDILRAERIARAQRGHVDLEQLKEILAANLVFKRPDDGARG